MWSDILLISLGLLTVAYFWMRKKFTFFRSKGIPEDPGYFPFGSQASWDMLSGKASFANLTDHTYKNFPNDPVVGAYGVFGQPVVIVRDLEMAKNVLIKDFDHFVDRSMRSGKANKIKNISKTDQVWDKQV